MKDKTFRTGVGDAAAIPSVDTKTCNLCGLCVKVCGTGLRIRDGAVVFDEDAFAGCIGCGHCMAICPSGSITVTGRRMSPEMRLPMPEADGVATPSQLEALLLKRRSVRIFSEREVEGPVLDAILRMASTAPMGIPPTDVEVMVFSGRKKVSEFRADVMDYFKSLSKYFNRGLLMLMRPFMKKVSYEMLRDFIRPVLKEYSKGMEGGADLLFYDCPLLLLFHNGPYSDPADSYIAATYAMIAAESLGLGTCMNGMIPVIDYSRKLRRKYGIPKGNKVALGIMMGYPGIGFQRTLRRNFASVSYR